MRRGLHMWARGVPKVTPFAGSYDPYGWRRRSSGEEERKRLHAQNMRRWREISRKNTVSESKRQVAWLAIGAPGHHFRRLDGGGKATGPRWVIESRPDADGYVRCADARGNIRMLHRLEDVRFVARQPEDPHSAACRALKRAHRQGLEA